MTLRPSPLLVLVTGAPCTGKTTLARRLAPDLRLPYLGKDAIKETLFDTLGWRDRDWSRQLGGATYRLLYQFAELFLAANYSLLLESNFRPATDSGRLRALLARHNAAVLQIVCVTEPTVLLARFRQRALSGKRHPGHVEELQEAEFTRAIADGSYGPLPLGGPTVSYDTTDLARLDYASLVTTIAVANPTITPGR